MAMCYVNAFVTFSPGCPAVVGTVPERPRRLEHRQGGVASALA